MNIHYLELLNSVTQTGWVQESGRVSPEQNYQEKSGHINSCNCSFKDANCAACTTTGAVLATKFTMTWFYDSTETLKPKNLKNPHIEDISFWILPLRLSFSSGPSISPMLSWYSYKRVKEPTVWVWLTANRCSHMASHVSMMLLRTLHNNKFTITVTWVLGTPKQTEQASVLTSSLLHQLPTIKQQSAQNFRQGVTERSMSIE